MEDRLPVVTVPVGSGGIASCFADLGVDGSRVGETSPARPTMALADPAGDDSLSVTASC